MKRLFILFTFFLATATGLRAQNTNLTEAVDFTATDCHGNVIHLFDLLDRGQAVFIDFFFYTCGQCQTISPYITESYTATGCNQHDVFFMEISYIDNNNVCQQWIDQYGVQFPTIGIEGGGDEIFNTYGINACPTLVLIMPDRSITIQGFQQLFPFSTNDVLNALEQYGGIQQYSCETIDCDAPSNLSLSLENDEVTLNWNASATAISYNVYRDGTKIATVAETSFVDNELEDLHEYCYKVTANCNGYAESDPTNEECITFTGVSDKDPASFKMFPNPVQDLLTITGDHIEHIVIYNVLGQKVREFNTKEPTLTFSTSNFENGVYFIRINDNHTRRLVVSHE
jgi:thiol-disulfide isomerase/thioredoxin